MLFALTPVFWGMTNPINTCAESLFLDAVVASIDDRPITLSEVSARMMPPTRMTLSEAEASPAFKQALDELIAQRLIEAEASERKLSVTDDEVAEYMREVATRNSLSPEEFLVALRREGRSENEYKAQIKSDILRSKLAGSFARGSVAVSDEEVNKALNETGEEKKNAPSELVTLRQIMLSAEHHSAEEAEKVLEDLKEKIEDGASFTELVEANSEAPDASDGGLLGEVALSDLNSDIAAAVEDLDEGEISEVVKSDQGYHLFLLEARASAPVPDESESRESEDGEDPNMRREQVRASLKQRKLESKMSEFFTKELYKLHSVDNKLEGNS